MDTQKPSSHSQPASDIDASLYICSPNTLFKELQSVSAPLIIDVRKNEPFLASTYTLQGAIRRDPLQVHAWANALPRGGSILIYCVHGHEVSTNTMILLHGYGHDVRFLQGGIEAWRTLGLPLAIKSAGSTTRWVTRARPKIDRIACPWLIRKFVDSNAEFLYVPTEQVRKTAQLQSATAYDIAPQIADTLFTHDGDLCSFDAFIKHYRLGQYPALACMATIVRAADTDKLNLAPQAAGLLAISFGMSHLYDDDLAMLDAMLPVYDSLYTWCMDAVAGKEEKHNWKPT